MVKNGYLCEDGVDDLANKMALLMKRRDMRVQFGIAARESMKKYATETVWNQWEDILKHR